MATATKKPAKAAAEKPATAAKAKAAKVKEPTTKEVTFKFEAPKASKVLIAGSFNNWKAETALSKGKSGEWTASLPLSPGRYEYRYVVDGNWINDPKSPAVANPYGGANNVIEVK